MLHALAEFRILNLLGSHADQLRQRVERLGVPWSLITKHATTIDTFSKREAQVETDVLLGAKLCDAAERIDHEISKLDDPPDLVEKELTELFQRAKTFSDFLGGGLSLQTREALSAVGLKADHHLAHQIPFTSGLSELGNLLMRYELEREARRAELKHPGRLRANRVGRPPTSQVRQIRAVQVAKAFDGVVYPRFAEHEGDWEDYAGDLAEHADSTKRIDLRKAIGDARAEFVADILGALGWEQPTVQEYRRHINRRWRPVPPPENFDVSKISPFFAIISTRYEAPT